VAVVVEALLAMVKAVEEVEVVVLDTSPITQSLRLRIQSLSVLAGVLMLVEELLLSDLYR